MRVAASVQAQDNAKLSTKELLAAEDLVPVSGLVRSNNHNEADTNHDGNARRSPSEADVPVRHNSVINHLNNIQPWFILITARIRNEPNSAPQLRL